MHNSKDLDWFYLEPVLLVSEEEVGGKPTRVNGPVKRLNCCYVNSSGTSSISVLRRRRRPKAD